MLCDPAKFSSVFEIPVTRENYIAAAWGEPLPEWTRELEAELPEELQDWSLFETVGDQIVLKKLVPALLVETSLAENKAGARACAMRYL